MLGRYIAAFLTQLFGFIGSIVVNSFLDIVAAITNLEQQYQLIFILIPYTITLIVILTMNYIYNTEKFDLTKFLGRH